MKKVKGSQYLIPYIDFAFMVIIIFIALLSIAYFEPPGKAQTSRKEIKVKQETKTKEQYKEKRVIIPLVEQKETKTEKKQIKKQDDKYKDEIKKYIDKIQLLEKEKEEKEKALAEKDKEIKLLKEKISKLEEEIKKQETKIVVDYKGKHEFTDLRK